MNEGTIEPQVAECVNQKKDALRSAEAIRSAESGAWPPNHRVTFLNQQVALFRYVALVATEAVYTTLT